MEQNIVGLRRAPLKSWRCMVCLLLAVLFLYNPFVAMSASVRGLAVAHPASHRSTVGSAELRHFTASDTQDTSGIETQAVPSFHLEALVVAISFLPRIKPAFTPQVYFSSGLWFRPPPAV
ncbi:MAG TPA: hypothetical protein VLV88_15570 [Terriglobales bacterium]|nr:hypothetical protein [Terriglobales bacterium]